MANLQIPGQYREVDLSGSFERGMRARSLLAVLNAIIALSCAEKTDDSRQDTALLLSSTAEPNLVAELAARQRDFYEALQTRPSDARAYLQDGFRTWNDADSAFADWETPPIWGHTTESLIALARKLSPDHFRVARYEVLTYRDSSIAVLAFRDGGLPSITVWEKGSGIWKARGMRVNASEKTVNFARTSAINPNELSQ
jgi:hypothetical protein